MTDKKPSNVLALDIDTAITHNLQGVGVIYSCPVCDSKRQTADERCCRRTLVPLVIMETHADILLGIDCTPMQQDNHGHC